MTPYQAEQSCGPGIIQVRGQVAENGKITYLGSNDSCSLPRASHSRLQEVWLFQNEFPPSWCNDAIYVVVCTNPSCSKAAPQYDAATLVLQSWNDVLQLVCPLLFPPNIKIIIMNNQFSFYLRDQRTFSPKCKISVERMFIPALLFIGMV